MAIRPEILDFINENKEKKTQVRPEIQAFINDRNKTIKEKSRQIESIQEETVPDLSKLAKTFQRGREQKGLELTPASTREVVEKISDVVLPVGGGILGSFIPGIGNTFGFVAGTIVGKALDEAGELIFDKVTGKKTKKIVPESLKDVVFEDTAIGNVLTEGVLAFGGAKVLKTLKPAFSSLLKTLSKGPITGPALNQFKTVLKSVVDKMPVKSKEDFIKHTALKFENFGLRPEVTKRVLSRNPSKVLKPEFLKEQSINQKTINNVSKTFDDALELQNNKFDDLVRPILNKNTKPIDIDDTLREYSDNISKLFNVSNKGKLIAKAPVDDEIAKTFNGFADDIVRLRNNPTPKALHKFKQNINLILDKRVIKDSSAAKGPLFNFKTSIVNKLETKIDGYKNISNEFRFIFELEEELGKKLEKSRVESLLNEYFQKNKTNFRTNIDTLKSINSSIANTFDKALDERAAKDFVSTITSGQRQFKVPLTRGLLGFRLGGKKKLDIAKQFLSKEKTGNLGPELQRQLSNLTGLGLVKTGAGITQRGLGPLLNE